MNGYKEMKENINTYRKGLIELEKGYRELERLRNEQIELLSQLSDYLKAKNEGDKE
jgi:hypothetical protein